MQAYFADSFIDAGIPNTIQVTGVSDVTAPSLVDLSFSPGIIDVSAGSHLVTISMHATDDLSGVKQGNMFLRGPSGQNTGGGFWGSPVSGDANDGIYECTIEFPQFSEAGTWYIYELQLYDNANNMQAYFADSFIDANIPNSIIVVPFVNVVPEVPLGTLMAVLAMFTCLVGFVVYKKFT
jgi:hypothetical protein